MSGCIATITARDACGVSSLVVLFLVLIVAAITDVRTGKIHNWTTYPAIAIGLIGHTLIGGLTGMDDSFGLVGSLGGLAAGFVPMFVAWFSGGIGGGDAKLLTAVMFWAGPANGLIFVLSMGAIGFVMAVGLIILRRVLKFYPNLFPNSELLRRPVAWVEVGAFPYGIAIGAAALVIGPAIFFP